MEQITIIDKKSGRIHICSTQEARDYINNKYPGLYTDLDGTIKAILDGAKIEAHHDIFQRVKNDKEVIIFFESQVMTSGRAGGLKNREPLKAD